MRFSIIVESFMDPDFRINTSVEVYKEVNYRPINQLSGFSNVFDRYLLFGIQSLTDSLSLFRDEQFVFRAEDCSTRQFLRLTDKITRR